MKKSVKKSIKIKSLKSNSTDKPKELKELGKKRRHNGSKKSDTKEITSGEAILKNLFRKNAEYDTSESEVTNLITKN